MKKTWIGKLKSNSGESISEVLIASLVVSLAFIMVLSMIMASQKIIKKTDNRMEDYYDNRNSFEEGKKVDTIDDTVVVQNANGADTRVMGNYDVTVQSGPIFSDDSTDKYISYSLKKAGS